MSNLRIILDTNVLIDGARDEFSAGFKIIDWVLQGELTAVISHRISREAHMILKKQVQDDEYKHMVENFLNKAERVGHTPRLDVVKDDRQDNKFIEAAAVGDVDYIITSDYHLLDLGHYGNTAIIKPEEFVNSYEVLRPELGLK